MVIMDSVIEHLKQQQLYVNKLISNVFLYMTSQKYPDGHLDNNQTQQKIWDLLGNHPINLIKVKINENMYFVKEDELSNSSINIYELNEEIADLQLVGLISNRIPIFFNLQSPV